MIHRLLREDRLVFWDLLVRGNIVERGELDQFVTKLVHDASAEERVASILLIASSRIAIEESAAMRRNLVAALRYWFSRCGAEDRPTRLDFASLRKGGLLDFMGLRLNWEEALRTVGRNSKKSIDYPALKRLEKKLKEYFAKEWEQILGSSPPSILSEER